MRFTYAAFNDMAQIVQELMQAVHSGLSFFKVHQIVHCIFFKLN